MSGSTLPQAFKLVRNLLAERPRAFQEILRDGLPAAPSTSTSSASTTTTMRGKGKGRLVPGTSNVPEGHPFVSASYLKTRILPILSSQGLITKSKQKGSHTYTISTTPIADHWTRLESGESPSSLGHEYINLKAQISEERKQARAVAEGTAEERLVWYRNSKEMGRLAVPLDRGYLNRRRSKKRFGDNKDREGKLEGLIASSEPWEVSTRAE